MTPKPTVVAEPPATPRPPTGSGDSAASRRRPLLALAGDERLARRARGGDRAALEAIFRRYEQDLYRFCMGILGEPQDAQDALQNTMVKVLRALPGERREIKLKPWLYRVAHNEAVELRRRQRPTDPLQPEVVASGASLDEKVEGEQRLAKLFEDMADLPDRQRAALIMRELNGLEFGEIAAALATSPGAVRQALYEARRGLNEMQRGREMGCAEVTRILSDREGSTRGRRDVRAHLRECPRCRRFQGEIGERRQTLAAISPLPAVVAVALAKGAIGGSGGAGLGAAGGALGGGAAGGGAVATSVGTAGVVKSVAGILAVVAFGTAAADRSGLIHLGSGHPQHPGDRGAAVREGGGTGSPPGGARIRTDRGSSAGHRLKRAAVSGRRPSGSRAGALQAMAGGRIAGSTAASTGVGEPPSASPVPSQGTTAEGHAAHPAHQNKGAEKATGAGAEKAAKAHPKHPAHPEHPAHPAQGANAGTERSAHRGSGASGKRAGAGRSAKEASAKKHPEHLEQPAHAGQPQKAGGGEGAAAATGDKALSSKQAEAEPAPTKAAGGGPSKEGEAGAG